MLACAGCGGSSSDKATATTGAAPTAVPAQSSPTPAPSPAVPAQAVAGAEGPDLRFGVQTHFAQGWPVARADVAAGQSIGSVRDELYWSIVEASPGTYKFPASYDGYMSALAKGGLAPLIELDFENPNYDGGDTPYTAAGIEGYSNYCTAVLGHYGDQIKAVEIWNEYNGSFAKGPATKDAPGTYTRMLKQAYAQIKARRPDVTVAGGSTAGVPLPYWQQLFADGALSSMDVLSIHPYRYNQPPEGIETDVAALQGLAGKYDGGHAKPIWATEIGWQVQAGGKGLLAIDEDTQAKFLVRAYALLLSAGVQRVYWYDLFDDPGSTQGLYPPDGTARASADAMKVMIGELTHAALDGREPTADGLYSVLFTRSDGTELRVMWSLQPTAFSATGVAGIVDMLGKPVGFSGQLELTDSPEFVAGPLRGLPAAPDQTQITDSDLDYAAVQGQKGWWYGESVGGAAFTPLERYSVTDWTAAWSGTQSYLGISPGDQHPSTEGSQQVAAVRRWVSTVSGTLHVVGQFQGENAGGDGVGVSVVVDGQPAKARAVIGGSSPEVGESFDFERPVKVGSTVDFVVDPGPALNINFDATAVSATISLLK